MKINNDPLFGQQTTITCPWCYNITEYDKQEEVQHCQVCRRMFTEEDFNEQSEEN